MRNTDILRGNVVTAFFQYVSMNMLSMFAMSLYFLADTFFIANGIGSQGLVALNLALPAYSFISGIGLMVGTGGATQYAIASAAGDTQKASRAFTQSLAVAVSIGAVYMVVCLLFSNPFAALLGAEGDVLAPTLEYIRTILVFSCAFIANNVVGAFVRNDGQPRLAMIAMVAGSFSNIVLDYVLIFPLRLGMFGAALATGASPVISLCILSLHFIRGDSHLRLRRCPFSIRETGRILFTGLPAFVNEMSVGVVILVFNMSILALAGDKGVAAYGIITNIALVCTAFFTGIGQGMQPVVSTHFGAGNHQKVRKALSLACALACVCGALFFLAGQLFPAQMAAAFNRDADAELAQLTVRGIRLYFTAYLMMGVNVVLTSFFASVSHPRPSFLLSVSRSFAAVVPAVILLARLLGLDGVWLSVPAAEAVTLVLGLAFLFAFLSRSRPRQ